MKHLLLFLFVSLILSGIDGKAQTALEFDGTNQYVQTTYPGVMGNNPRTLMAWIYLDEDNGATKCIMDYGQNVAYGRNTFMLNGTEYLSYLSGGSGSGITADVASVPIGEWVHVAFVYDGSDAFLYQNGVQVGTKTFVSGINTPSGAENLKIAQRVAGGSIPFNGMIDELTVWDVALAEQEISDYACISDPILYDNLGAYYDFNEGTATILTDLVSGNNGTLTSMAEEDWVGSDVCESGHKITFVVTEDDGTTPIENAEVDLDGDILSTNVNGEAIYYAYEPGTYNYTISKAGYVDETGTVTIVDDDVTVDVSLALTGIDYDITFIVTDETTTNPIENALVDFDGVQQYTDISGETIFTGYLPGTYSYTITMAGYFITSGSVDVINDNVTVEVSLLSLSPTALEFDGTDYVQTTYPGIMENNHRTFMAWIYRQADLTATKCIMDYGQNAAYGRNTFIVNGTGYLAYLSGGTNSGITATEATIPDEEWTHVAFVYDGDSAYLYQNGVKVGSKAITGPNTPSGYTDFRIGRRVGGTIQWKGMLDEVSVWDVALTQQEVSDYACIDDPLTYTNLVVYYDFNDGTGTTLTDLVGGYDGTLTDMEEEDWVESDVCGMEYYTLSGNVTYANAGMTILEGCTVELFDDTDALVGSTTTDVDGNYEFTGLLDGDYTLVTINATPRDGTGLLDIVQTRQFMLGQITFITLQQMSADVDAGGNVGLLDIVQMRQFMLGQITEWDQTDWVFELQNATVSGADLMLDYQGLCSGDPDGSHTP